MKALKDLENAKKVAAAEKMAEEVKPENKLVVSEKVEQKSDADLIKGLDPAILKAASAAASAIIDNEKAMKQKEEDSRPKTVLDEVSKMVT